MRSCFTRNLLLVSRKCWRFNRLYMHSRLLSFRKLNLFRMQRMLTGMCNVYKWISVYSLCNFYNSITSRIRMWLSWWLLLSRGRWMCPMFIDLCNLLRFCRKMYRMWWRKKTYLGRYYLPVYWWLYVGRRRMLRVYWNMLNL